MCTYTNINNDDMNLLRLPVHAIINRLIPYHACNCNGLCTVLFQIVAINTCILQQCTYSRTNNSLAFQQFALKGCDNMYMSLYINEWWEPVIDVKETE